jgi:hypothetical protein
MRIESAAGEFDFTIESMRIDGDDIVIIGKMGVWEAETVMTREDARKMIQLGRKTPGIFRYLAGLLRPAAKTGASS